jgi:hypothetical protein
MHFLPVRRRRQEEALVRIALLKVPEGAVHGLNREHEGISVLQVDEDHRRGFA